MKWIIEDIFSNTEQIIDALTKQNIPFEIIEKFSISKYINHKEKFIYYGSIFGCREAIKHNGIVYLNEKNLLCSSYYPYFSDYLLNTDYVIIPLIELKKRFHFFSNVFRSDQLFVRPNSPVKIFTGQILNETQIDDFADYFNSLVIVSSPKKIDSEFRFFISNNQVISGCQYIENDDICICDYVDPNALLLAQKLANSKWKPDDMFILDIAIFENKPFLLEFNAVSCADYYAMDATKILLLINQYSDISRN